MARSIISYTAAQRIAKRYFSARQKEKQRTDLFGILCAMLFLMGIAVGVAVIYKQKRSDLFIYLATTAQTQIVRCCKKGLLYAAATHTAARAVTLLLCVVMANSSLGSPFVCCILLANGCGMGLLGGYILAEFGLKGLLLSTFLVTLPGAIYAWGLVRLSAAGLRLSGRCFAAAFLHSGESAIDRAEGIFIR
ncbi:MAG: hypothetical protein IKV55_00780, partial [Oscillospiraceae bacterium]|nr:hypothetical protein [Oscillospiraceae bacterium]